MVKLSIVIAYYKTYGLTVKLLNCLIKQLTEEVEVFLVDDGCNEKRLDVFKDKINIIHLERNNGGAYADNVGIKKATGKYIAIIDSDDMVTDDYVETLLKAIDERTEDVIFFGWKDVNNNIVILHPTNYAPWKAIYKKEIMPLFKEGWIFSYDVPFQEELNKIKHSEHYLKKVLYLYNSNREGNLTARKEKLIKKSQTNKENNVLSLSVLIPYYKTYDLTMKLLKELNIQKTNRAEIILIDDGCNETRFDEFKNKNNFDELKIIHLEKNQGMSNALNVGLDNVNGEYIAFIDSDDQITMDYIDILIETIDTHDEDIIYFNWADFNKNELVRRPENYALWKAIYRKEIFPRFENNRRANNDVPVQKKLRAGDFSEFYLDRVLYIYNSNRVGSITWNSENE